MVHLHMPLLLGGRVAALRGGGPGARSACWCSVRCSPGWPRRSFVSLTAVFVVVGFVLGDGGDRGAALRRALALRLRTGHRRADRHPVPRRARGRRRDAAAHWHLPFRKLVLAMPLTALIVAAGTRLLTGLSWTESFLRGRAAVAHRPGAVLERGHQSAGAAAGASLAQPRVGLNDGLALPAVLALAAALAVGARTSCGGAS